MSPAHDDGHVCAIGSMTMDRVLGLQGPVTAGAINAVQSTRRASGGSARNLAECLARLAVPVRLLSLVGDDQDGRDLVLETSRQGVDTGLVQKSLSRPTASFVTIERPDGTLHAAFADMGICEAMDRAFIQNRWLPISHSPLVFADAWLPADSLAWLIAGCRQHRLPLVVDAVSSATARHLPLALHGVALLFCDTDEARAILGDELERDAQDMAAALQRRGAARVLVAGVNRLVCAGRTASFALPSEPGRLASPLARAAFLAGIVHARLQRRRWRSSLERGLEAAGLVDARQGSAEALRAESFGGTRASRRAD